VKTIGHKATLTNDVKYNRQAESLNNTKFN